MKKLVLLALVALALIAAPVKAGAPIVSFSLFAPEWRPRVYVPHYYVAPETTLPAARPLFLSPHALPYTVPATPYYYAPRYQVLPRYYYVPLSLDAPATAPAAASTAELSQQVEALTQALQLEQRIRALEQATQTTTATRKQPLEVKEIKP